ncbi:hypothetical protein POM88_012108 [Heracleum sosnowskyi]|uniref:Uncharacterized protein n=1 Tax=Heracleum sosnowskyi TaxID=360622 RepID=A0AAD8IVU0_9APIA|nr:hypothetical protein POM88_012108 [Heracleum sosnowskyi]
MQSVNNKALIVELDNILAKLRIIPEYATCLTEGSFDEMAQNVKEKRAELQILRSSFVQRASEFLRICFANLVDFMLSDKNYFSQRGQLKRPDHADLRYKCRTYALFPRYTTCLSVRAHGISMFRVYPQIKIDQMLVFLTAKPGFEAYVLDFQVRKNVNSSPDDRKKRLLKSQISLTEERRKRNITLLVEEVMAELEFVTEEDAP